MSERTHKVMIITGSEKMKNAGVRINGRTITLPAKAFHRTFNDPFKGKTERYLLGTIYIIVQDGLAAWVEDL